MRKKNFCSIISFLFSWSKSKSVSAENNSQNSIWKCEKYLKFRKLHKKARLIFQDKITFRKDISSQRIFFFLEELFFPYFWRIDEKGELFSESDDFEMDLIRFCLESYFNKFFFRVLFIWRNPICLYPFFVYPSQSTHTKIVSVRDLKSCVLTPA